MDHVSNSLLSKVESHVTGTWDLEHNLDRLRNSLLRVRHLMEKAEWWRFENPSIATLLMQLRHANYDAEDVIAEHDCYKLKQKMEGQSSSLLLSPIIYFINSLLGNTACKVKDAQTKLDFISSELENVISPLHPFDGPNPYGKALQADTSSLPPELVFGRDNEIETVIKLLVQHGDDGAQFSDKSSISSFNRAKRRKTGNYFILPIVGTGGIGKTTFAQQIYNDDRVKSHFDLRIWVCVSDYFDLKKVTKEMIESANTELATKGRLRNNVKQIIGIGDNLSNLDSLQQILIEKIMLRRYLIVLDDVWHERIRDWDILCSPLRFGAQGSMVLITTRMPKVAEVLGTLNPIYISGLPDDVYWKLFKQCAFRSDDSSLHPEIENIGKKIAAKLKGSPLAAKILGGILHENMTTKHWRNIMETELWELEQGDDGILVAMRVSYQYLTVHHKRCFLGCSLFPKDYPLQLDYLSPVWMADGAITREKSISNLEGNKRIKYFGAFFPEAAKYFEDLINRSFIMKDQHNGCVLHDLMHDFARSLSMDIYSCQENEKWSLQNSNNVRHLSVHSKYIESTFREICRCKKLRSLLFFGASNYKVLGLPILTCLFNELPNLRVLNLRGCSVAELPDNIDKLKLLLYINLKGSKIKRLPDSICRLYNLQVFYVEGCPIESFPNLFTNLVNLRVITDTEEISSKIPEMGKLASLEKLPEFKVLKERGHKIDQLKNLTRLRGHLKISNLENIEGWQDAAQAFLNNKEYLTSLTLSWLQGRNTSSGYEGIIIDQNIIEGLCPHPNLEHLYIENYVGKTKPSWLETEKLPRLHSLGIEDWFLPHQLVTLRSLVLEGCVNIVSLSLEWISSSSLTRLKIKNCPLICCPKNTMLLPSSLSQLTLDSCGELDKSLPICLENLQSFEKLELRNCQHVTSLPRNVTHNLKAICLSNCQELQLLEISNPSVLKILIIQKCLKLTLPNPSIVDRQAPLGLTKPLQELLLDNTSLPKLPFSMNSLQSMDMLEIYRSPEERIFTGDVKGSLNQAADSLEEIDSWECCIC